MDHTLTDNASSTTAGPQLDTGKLSDISRSTLRSHVSALYDRLLETESTSNAHYQASLKQLISQDLLILGYNKKAWSIGREAFLEFLDQDDWQAAAEVCDTLYQTEQNDPLGVLAQGIWLSLHRPITTKTAATLLLHLLQEMPEDSQDNPIIAATILFLSVSRSEKSKHKQLIKIAGGILMRHAEKEGIKDRKAFEHWLGQHGLDRPGWFLPQLHNILFELIEDDWWFDHRRLDTGQKPH